MADRKLELQKAMDDASNELQRLREASISAGMSVEGFSEAIQRNREAITAASFFLAAEREEKLRKKHVEEQTKLETFNPLKEWLIS